MEVATTRRLKSFLSQKRYNLLTALICSLMFVSTSDANRVARPCDYASLIDNPSDVTTVTYDKDGTTLINCERENLESVISADMWDQLDSLIKKLARRFTLIDDEGIPDIGVLGCKVNNMYASDKPHPDYPQTKGLLIFSPTFVMKYLNKHVSSSPQNRQGVPIAIMIAHEMAHLLQFRRNLWSEFLEQNNGSIRHGELHADFIAGWALGSEYYSHDDEETNTWIEPGSITEYAAALHLIESESGSSDDKCKSHGTPSERFAAVLLGYDEARKKVMDLNEVIENGSYHINTMSSAH